MQQQQMQQCQHQQHHQQQQQQQPAREQLEGEQGKQATSSLNIVPAGIGGVVSTTTETIDLTADEVDGTAGGVDSIAGGLGRTAGGVSCTAGGVGGAAGGARGACGSAGSTGRAVSGTNGADRKVSGGGDQQQEAPAHGFLAEVLIAVESLVVGASGDGQVGTGEKVCSADKLQGLWKRNLELLQQIHGSHKQETRLVSKVFRSLLGIGVRETGGVVAMGMGGDPCAAAAAGKSAVQRRSSSGGGGGSGMRRQEMDALWVCCNQNMPLQEGLEGSLYLVPKTKSKLAQPLEHSSSSGTARRVPCRQNSNSSSCSARGQGS
jgi:hypothetical protein